MRAALYGTASQTGTTSTTTTSTTTTEDYRDSWCVEWESEFEALGCEVFYHADVSRPPTPAMSQIAGRCSELLGDVMYCMYFEFRYDEEYYALRMPPVVVVDYLFSTMRAAGFANCASETSVPSIPSWFAPVCPPDYRDSWCTSPEFERLGCETFFEADLASPPTPAMMEILSPCEELISGEMECIKYQWEDWTPDHEAYYRYRMPAKEVVDYMRAALYGTVTTSTTTTTTTTTAFAAGSR
mmetsp:Transcript_26863/g.62257  ORF Transcript_26863/g.62257 Transcript_26863/m.62257 type:complete len:241 (-) Transcript_26863:326-1048(-)